MSEEASIHSVASEPSTLVSAGSDTSTLVDSNTRSVVAVEKPQFERSIDVLVQGAEIFDPMTTFVNSLPGLSASEQKPPFLDHLTMATRFKIYEYVFANFDDQANTLSRYFATKDVFPEDHFKTYKQLLRPGKNLAKACVRIREEVMNFIWIRYRFHVALSQFTGERTSALSQKMLRLYGNTLQRLTIEVDLTRLGFGADPRCALLSADPSKMKEHVANIIQWMMLDRVGKVAEIHLMCRRYAGERPVATLPDGVQPPVAYCPDSSLTVFLPSIKALKGHVTTLRLSGFPSTFTTISVLAVFPPGTATKMPSAPAWPEVPEPVITEETAQGLADEFTRLELATRNEIAPRSRQERRELVRQIARREKGGK